MMLYPSMSDLLEKVDCRYTLVIEVSKRARQLIAGDPSLLENTLPDDKAVSIAVNEIHQNKIEYRRSREGLR